jgi:hypothetical protein
MRIPILQGRALEESDKAGTEPVVVVNQEFARKYLPGTKPLGHHFRYFGMDSLNEPTMTIVGVAGNVRTDALAAPATPEAYVSYLQHPSRTRWPMTIAVRARQARGLAAVLPSVRTTIASVDGDVPVQVSTMFDLVAKSVADRRFTMTVLSTFACVALLLATAGIYGVLSQTVLQRTGEIGVRMALGAEPGSVARLILTAAIVPVLLGIVVGGAGAALGVRLLREFLFGVTPFDPAAFAAAATLLAVVAVLAAYLPARRATRVDPLSALRAQ